MQESNNKTETDEMPVLIHFVVCFEEGGSKRRVIVWNLCSSRHFGSRGFSIISPLLQANKHSLDAKIALIFR